MRYRRSDTPGATYFFTVVTFRRYPIFAAPENPALLKSALRYVMARHPFTIDAMVVLPDHLHCLWTLPEYDADFATRWMLVKSHFSRHCDARFKSSPSAARRAKGEQTVWQRRYWEHQIRDEADFAAHCDYIHYNPVKHGLTATAADWPHSSFVRFVERGIYPADWGNDPADFAEGIGSE
ncbi:MAG: transposase [Sulfuricella sp.]|nr:transposase [Sulfuricella sp.]